MINITLINKKLIKEGATPSYKINNSINKNYENAGSNTRFFS